MVAERVPLIKRLLAKMEINISTECWEWTGYTNKLGYGKIRHNNKSEFAHRAAYAVFIGEIPENLFVCHRCDNRKCINPRHLFVGTQGDNMTDMKQKMRRRGVGGQKGEAHHKSKLSEADVIGIRASDDSISELARRFNMSRSYVWAVKNHKTWKHI